MDASLRSMLQSAMPNPFQTRATLVYDLPRRGRAVLRIYDVSGRLVRGLVPGIVQEAGHHTVVWDGRNDTGSATTAGLYFARLDASGASGVRRLVRIR